MGVKTLRKRYAIVGTGSRSVLYIEALAGRFAGAGELVGFCDLSRARMQWYNDRIASDFGHAPVPMFLAADFDRMITQTRPDVVIVLSIDSTHREYVIRAMQLGCDVICEKPLTTDAASAAAILRAIEETGKTVHVTFNMRYVPAAGTVFDLLRSGVVGDVTAVDFSWMLDTRHGADYFRRWHREKDKSGGLLIHKSTHHFDLVNWWVQSVPKTVFAMGGLRFYGRDNASTRGDTHLTGYDRYANSGRLADDPFALDLTAEPEHKGLFLDAEPDNGYVRDRNVFGDAITAEDTLAVMARYRNGVVLNYSLVCYSPREGWQAAITGTRGRLEIVARYGAHVIEDNAAAPGGASAAGIEHQEQTYTVTVLPMFKPAYTVPVPPSIGTHGGSDDLMFEQLFAPTEPDRRRAATHLDGAASILMGISANESIATGMPVDCDTLLTIPSPFRLKE